VSIQTPPYSAGVLGQGITYPPTLDTATGRLKLSWGTDVVAQSIQSICQTQPGERVMLPDYGAGSVTFDPIDMARMKVALEKSIADYEPRALDVDVQVSLGVPGEVIASIAFRVAGDATTRTLTYPLFVGP